MALLLERTLRASRSPAGRRMTRYLALSIFNLVAGQALIAFLFDVLRWSALRATLFAIVVGTGPAYYVSRRWVWQRRDRSHLVREVIPFWVVMFIAAFSASFAAVAAERFGRSLTTD